MSEINKFDVVWTQGAQEDLRRIIEYIAVDSPLDARKSFRSIKEKASNLCQMPHQGRLVPELKFIGVSIYRELIRHPWRIIYKVESNCVWVLAVIDGRRNMEDILMDRFLR